MPEPQTKAPTSEFADLAQTVCSSRTSPFTRDNKPLDCASVGTDTRSGELRTASLPSNNGLGNACELTRRGFCLGFRRTAGPSASPDFLSRVAASINCMWFSLGRTTYVVAGEIGEAGNPGTLGMTERRGSLRGEDRCPGARAVVRFVTFDTRSGELRTASLPSNNGLGNACELTRRGFVWGSGAPHVPRLRSEAVTFLVPPDELMD